LRAGSLFAGIGGFDLGFERAGFSLAWHAEIDKAASAILRYRWPDVPNLGDVTKIDGAAIEPVDVICGGFPCQDLSVAGKRAGFTGKRSVLAFEFLRIVREMREATDGRAPTFVVLENVPGLFTSSGGRDFGALLDALGELRPLDIAWRVLDSRYFGVAQRRRRVFVVVDFGGERAEEVLALREGLRRDSPARRAARKDVAGTLGSRTEKGGMRSTDLDGHGAYVISGAVSSKWAKGTGGPAGDECYNLVAHTLRADGFDASEDGTGRGTPIVPITFDDQRGRANGGVSINQARTLHAAKGQSEVQMVCCDTMRSHPRPGSNSTGLVIPFDERNVTHPQNRSRCDPGDPCHTMHASPPAVAIQGATGGARGQNGAGIGGDLAFSLDTTGAQGVATSGVRRLTPRECERLQGFPDSWTAIPGMADGPRYKCLGNAVTVSVAEWIARRMAEVMP
jgi:DNA (cytosine-5)-methyltransferase 1